VRFSRLAAWLRLRAHPGSLWTQAACGHHCPALQHGAMANSGARPWDVGGGSEGRGFGQYEAIAGAAEALLTRLQRASAAIKKHVA